MDSLTLDRQRSLKTASFQRETSRHEQKVQLDLDSGVQKRKPDGLQHEENANHRHAADTKRPKAKGRRMILPVSYID